MAADDLTELTIAEVSERIRSREVSSTALTEAYLGRIRRLEPSINAFITITEERAVEDARRADAEIGKGRYRGPMHGIPIGLKDLYETAGIRTTAGAKVHAGYVPEADSAAAQKLREAGSVLMGKTNTHEFAWGVTTNNPHHGATHNPWDLERIPGGSSGGSAAAIAARMVAGTLGTDTGGSIRIPAALCGCVGLKPTYGRVSKRGVFPMSWQFDHAGPITKTVEDAAIMLGAIAGYDPGDFSTVRIPVDDYCAHLRDGVQGLRIGVPRSLFYGLLDAEEAAAVEDAMEVFRRLGASVEDVEPGVTRDQVTEAWAIVNAEGQAYHAELFGARREEFGQDLQRVLSLPLPDAIGIARSLEAGYRLREQFRAVLEEVDLLITPTCMRPAAKIGEETVSVGEREVGTGAAFAGLTMPFNLAHLPVLALPCGFSSDGLPLSLSLAGRPFDEALVLRAGWAYEQATEWQRSPELKVKGQKSRGES